MKIRSAESMDANGMSLVLKEIILATGKDRLSDPSFVRANYIEHPDSIECSVAVDGSGAILGFQSLILATAGNPYGVSEGWGVIGTHISPRAHRQGIGSALFANSQVAARRANLRHIDASISEGNEVALRYYSALGFRTYKERNGVIGKVFTVI